MKTTNTEMAEKFIAIIRKYNVENCFDECDAAGVKSVIDKTFPDTRTHIEMDFGFEFDDADYEAIACEFGVNARDAADMADEERRHRKPRCDEDQFADARREWEATRGV